MKKVFRRKKYLVDYKFQLKYTLMIVAIIVVINAVSLLGLYFMMWGAVIDEFSEHETQKNLEQIDRISSIQESRERATGKRVMPWFLREAHLLSSHQQQQLAGIMKKAHENVIPKLIILLFLVGIASIFITHRIAGPLSRIKKILSKEPHFDLNNISVRKNDQLQDLVKSLRKTLTEYHLLQKKLSDLTGHIDTIIKDTKEQSVSQQTIISRLKELTQDDSGE
ncbi:hypothetical protein ACFL1T_02005 [Chlamydiota bacterium]